MANLSNGRPVRCVELSVNCQATTNSRSDGHKVDKARLLTCAEACFGDSGSIAVVVQQARLVECLLRPIH